MEKQFLNYRNLILCFAVTVLAACQTTEKIETPPEEPPVPELPALSWATFMSEEQCRLIDEEVLSASKDATEEQAPPTVYPVAPGENIWPRLQAGLNLEYVDHPSVQRELNWYVKHPGYMQRVQQRSARYLHFVLEHLHEENVPYDLALLPIVESAYEPFAYSHGQASGLWQFIPGTGRRFKLQKNWWLDGRRDAVDSTRAAIKYLKYLHRFFDGDWQLAIAAYNAGEGTVRKAVRKNKAKGKPTDFWHLDLPKETSAYVPKMVALTAIFKDPAKYNIDLVAIDNAPYFDSVTLTEQLDLTQAANLADVPMEEIYYLNAGLNRWATPPDQRYDFKLPVDKIEQFKQNLSELPANQRVSWKRHKIKPGDSLSTIAERYDSDKRIIQQVNKLKGNQIIAGKTLLIPTATGKSSDYRYSYEQRLNRKQNRKPGKLNQKINYYVQSGDSFWSIAKAHKVKVSSLAKWNNKSPKDLLKPGEKLVVWTRNKQNLGPLSQRSNIRKINYRIRKGDSLAKLASKFNVKVPQIVQWNNINPKKYLQPGQALKLYVDVMDTH